jgi:hypothetical protein
MGDFIPACVHGRALIPLNRRTAMSETEPKLTRRNFLIGGSVAATVALTSSYLKQIESIGKVILRPPTAYDTVLYADESRGFLLILDHTYDQATETLSDLYMTWREYLAWKGEITDADNLRLSDFRNAYQEYGKAPRELDEPVASDLMEKAWKFDLGPEAQTYYFLKDLDLLEVGPQNKAYASGLGEVREDGMLYFYYGYQAGRTVNCSDLASVALLQEKLIDLGQPIKIEIV